MAGKNHIHRYERTVLGKKGYVVWKCNFPDCTHYIADKLADGRKTICNRCGREMILDKRAKKLVRPHCVDCIEVRKKSPIHDKLLEFIEANDLSS